MKPLILLAVGVGAIIILISTKGVAAIPVPAMLRINNKTDVEITAKLIRVSGSPGGEMIVVEAGNRHAYEIDLSRCGVGKLRKLLLSANANALAEANVTIWSWRSQSLGCSTNLRLRWIDEPDGSDITKKQPESHIIELIIKHVP